MKVRVLIDAIVGAGHFLMAGDEVELADLGEFGEAMLRDGVVECVEPILAVTETPIRANPAWLF